MKKMKNTSLFAATLLLANVSSFAQNQFSDAGSGLVQDAANWSGGLPTSAANVGIIDTGDVNLLVGNSANPTETPVVGLFIEQNGGNIRSQSFQGSEFDSTTWTVNGGTLGSTNGIFLKNGSLLTLNTGGAAVTAGGRNMTVNDSTFTMNGGTLTVGKSFSTTSSGTNIINFLGGTANVASMGNGFFNQGTYNFGGTNITTGSWGASAKTGARTLNFQAATGTFSVTGNFDAGTTTMDWVSGSDYTLTISGSLLDAGAATTFETLYNDGRILLDGSNSATFASVFDVSGGSLSLVPEPSSFALLAGMLGLTWVMLRRRS